MWTYEHHSTTTALPNRVYALWADVATWPQWNADVKRADLLGPFASGSRIMMATAEDTLELHLTDVDEHAGFTDEVQMDGLCIRTRHQLQSLEDGQTRVTYRLEISGPQAADLGPVIGPAITSDFPQTVAALIHCAER